MFKEINFAYLKAVLDHKKLLQEPVVIANDVGDKEIVITNEVLVLNTTKVGVIKLYRKYLLRENV